MSIQPQRRGQQTDRFVGPTFIQAESSKDGFVSSFRLVKQGDEFTRLTQHSLGTTQSNASGTWIHRHSEIIASTTRELLTKCPGHRAGVGLQYLDKLNLALTQTFGFIRDIKNVNQS